jgi:hypothetical protein
MMTHTRFHSRRFYPRRLLLAALAFGLILVAPRLVANLAAANAPSVSITADATSINAGGKVTLSIKLQNVTNATLNGDLLTGNNVMKTVTVCATTTYTVAATSADGATKFTQAVTVNASGQATNSACFPDRGHPRPDSVAAPRPGPTSPQQAL